METFKYKDRKKYDPVFCRVCGKYKSGELKAHHIGHRRNSDDCIWVCFSCHRRIHDNPKWAYKEGYLIKTNLKMKKAKKIKRCDHKVTYWSNEENDFVCQFCGKKIGELRVSKRKKK